MFSLCFVASHDTYDIIALVSQNLRYLVNISLNKVANSYYKYQTKMVGGERGWRRSNIYKEIVVIVK